MDPIESSGNLSSGIPLKRKRGRPRKDPNLKHSGRAHKIPPGFEAAQQYPPETTPAAPEAVIGQAVNGVIEASFDGGYLLSVRIGNSDTSLRGVLFKPGHYVPVTTENDIAPHVQMIRREGGVFSTETQSSSRGQKLAVQRAGTKQKLNQTQSNPVPFILQPGNFQAGSGALDNDDKDVHMVEPISMLPPDRIVPVSQLFGAGQTHSNHQGSGQEENGSLNDGTSSEDGHGEKSKSKIVTSASADTNESSQMSDGNIENGKQALKSSGDSDIVVSKQETGTFDVPFSKDSGTASNQDAGNARAQEQETGNVTMQFSAVPVTTPLLNFGTGRMTDLLQAVQENIKDAPLHVAEQPGSVSNVEFRETMMASETDHQNNANDP